MKRLLTTVIATVTVCLLTTGKTRTEQQLIQAAQSFLQKAKANTKAAEKHLTLTKVISDRQLTIFNCSNGHSIIMTNDDMFAPVIGYTEQAVSTDNMAPAFKWWIEKVNQSMEDYLTKGIAPNKAEKDTNYREEVTELLTTKWGQDVPYCNLSPTYTQNNKTYHYMTGCVATAMAQVMKYHHYPEKGKGYNRWTYFPNGNSSTGTTIRVNFANIYDWDNMLDTYTRTNYTNEQANAVATIMKDCGGSVSMQYTSSGSGAYASDACLALRKNFQYSQATKLYTRYFLPKNDWMDIIYRELNDSCPILYGGTTTDGAGHEFVFDGYDKNGLVHVNWGWDGTNNGYFDVALLNSSEGNFTENQNMVIVRHPDDNRRDATYHSLWGTDTGLNITLAGSKAKISNFTIYNIDVENFTGYVQLVAKNTSTGYVTPLTDFALIENMEYGYGNKYSYEADLSELENGQYLVYAGSSSTASGKEELDWQPVTGNENITTSYLLTVDQGKFTLVKTNENISTGIANAPTKEEKANETQVYNMQGQLVMQSATSNIDINRLPTHATFIVRQGAKTVKIIR